MIKAQQYETNLRELIEENGYTFKEVSEETGISLSALFIYARGERPIPHESRCKIARVIGCPATDVISKKQPQREVSKKIVADDFLSELEDGLMDRWNLYHTVGAKYAYFGLDTKLQELDRLGQIVKSTRWSTQVLTLLTMGYQLQSCVLRDMMNYKQSHVAYQKAFDVARELESQELMVSALAREGVTLIQQEKPQEAVIYLTGALNILDGYDSSVLRGYILIQEKDVAPAAKAWDTALGACYMCEQAVQMGVPPEAILVENESLHTKENAEMVLALAKEHHMRRIILVTSPFHQRRTYLTFAKVFQSHNVEILNYYADTGEWHPATWFLSAEYRELVRSEEKRIETYRAKGDLL